MPWLWTVFVLAWLPVFGISAWGFAQNDLGAPLLAVVVLGLLTLAGLYLLLTLRGALSDADLTLAGPSLSTIGRRLLVLAAMLGQVSVLAMIVPEGSAWWLVQHIVIGAGLALPLGAAAGVTVVLVALAFAGGWLVGGQVEVLLLLQVAFGAGAMAIRQLTITVRQLHAAREEVARLAVADERLRFARDLHDLLGHSLSVIVLKSELAGKLLPSAPERAATEIRDVEHGAREALHQVRAAVAGYRLPTLEGELVAARELLAAAGIDSTIEHAAGPLPTVLDGLLAWAVREGVTNVIHHSHARHCSVFVSHVDGMARMEVRDDGQGAPSGLSRGNGLAGLSERATTYGASLEAGPLPEGGFSLVMEVPTANGGGREKP